MIPEERLQPSEWTKPDYGVDAPNVLRNLLLFGTVLLILAFLLPHHIRVGNARIGIFPSLLLSGAFLLVEGVLMLLYVKFGKFRHRDFLLSLHTWRGDEQVLDVGCGRGLLLAAVAKRLSGSGHATGIDIWSNVDMGGNSEAATRRNLEMEGVAQRCDLASAPAQDMEFADSSFDVVVSNLCIHNIYDKSSRTAALAQIVRVLKPGGVAILSDYKLTGEYAAYLAAAGFAVERRWGSLLTTFPPLRVVIAKKGTSGTPSGI